ncbi:MAG TPA: ABC transporter substrate-binding protein [Longimicrobium sp.]|nr:ABC transporter substrate-binding protein [Longimicrobium sp.]
MKHIRQIVLLLVFTAASFVQSPAARAQQPAADTLRIGLVLPETPARMTEMQSAARGVRMGAEEAARSAALFGRTVVLVEGADPERLVRAGRVRALLGGFETGECQALADAAERLGVVFLDLGCGADALRGAGCRASTFHVAPSAAMEADAAVQAGGVDGRVVAWDARLERFGADQLNRRFRARYGEGMDSQGWVGWFAVKLLWESTLRARSAMPGALAAYLRSGAAQFDGHKGRALSFRPWDGQLRQPLYVTRASSPEVIEVPRATPGDEASSSDVLDRLGTPRDRSECRIGR